MKRKQKGLSMSSLIILLVMTVVTVCMSITILLFVQNYKRVVYQNAETASGQTVVQVCNMVSLYNQEMYEILNFLTEHYEENSEQWDQYVSNFLEARPQVVAVSAYDAKGTMTGCWCYGHELRKDLLENLSFDIENIPQSREISAPHVVSFFESYYPWAVTCCELLPGGNYLAIDFAFSGVSDYINNVGIGQHGYCYLINKEGKIIYHPQQQLINSGLKSEENESLSIYGNGVFREDTRIYAVSDVADTNWKVVGVSYVDEMVSEAIRGAYGFVLITACVILITAFLISYLVTIWLSRPLRMLGKEMRQFEEDADGFTYQPVGRVAEVRRISESFEHMVIQIRYLMERIRKEEIILRKTELKALQAQINPHFLYNTLDSIYVMCQRGKNKEAGDMVMALSRLFRISISRGRELIPIEKELEHAENYLKIQKFRFSNQFTYDFEVEEDCKHYLCNKITLQPLLENAILHGLNGLVDEGEIIIRVRTDGDDILMQVEDNGCGMDEDTIAALLSEERSEKQGIGIYNVNARLKIYFGENYGLSMESEQDLGTTVTVRMPKVETEENYEKR